MRIETLQAFLKVLECESFTTAAEELYISQSTLSKQINELEKALGQRLLKRSTRCVTATPSGRVLQAYAQRIVDEWGALEQKMCELQQPPKSKICIGYTTSEQLTFVYGGLKRREWARRSIEVSLLRKHPSQVFDALRDGVIDCAVLHRPTFHDKANMRADCLVHSSIYALVPIGSPFSDRTSLTLSEVSELIDVRCLHSRDPYYYDEIDRAFTQAGLKPPRVLETGESEELEILALQSGCMSLCPSIYPVWKKFVSIPVTDCKADFDFLFVRAADNTNLELDYLYAAIRAAIKNRIMK